LRIEGAVADGVHPVIRRMEKGRTPARWGGESGLGEKWASEICVRFGFGSVLLCCCFVLFSSTKESDWPSTPP
jgi:hypothetical protein